MTDPIADLLTRIRNAQRAGLEQLELPASKMKQRICEVLRDEGFVREVASRGDGKRSEERRVGKECRSRWSPYH